MDDIPPTTDRDAEEAESPAHVPVMAAEVLSLLNPQPGRAILDCTVGRGGHAALIVPRLAPAGRFIGLDLDPANVEHLPTVVADDRVQIDVLHRNFADARAALDELNVDFVDGMLADLGFASTQVDDPARGLSFRADGPLDMRLDPTQITTAADLINSLPERELADLIWRYGEERLSRRIARKIAETRRRHPIRTTRQLADLCATAYGPRQRGRIRIDPATRTFQALRIAVNDELGNLRVLLDSIPSLLRPGGRAVMISFHSLEDRLVKHAFRELARQDRAVVLTARPLSPKPGELAANRRCRSAKCRAIELKSAGG